MGGVECGKRKGSEGSDTLVMQGREGNKDKEKQGTGETERRVPARFVSGQLQLGEFKPG